MSRRVEFVNSLSLEMLGRVNGSKHLCGIDTTCTSHSDSAHIVTVHTHTHYIVDAIILFDLKKCMLLSVDTMLHCFPCMWNVVFQCREMLELSVLYNIHILFYTHAPCTNMQSIKVLVDACMHARTHMYTASSSSIPLTHSLTHVMPVNWWNSTLPPHSFTHSFTPLVWSLAFQ